MTDSIMRLIKRYSGENRFFKEQNTIFQVVIFYRYSSLLITSIFYFLGPPQSSIIFKLGVSLSLLIAANITMNLYKKYKNNHFLLQVIVLIETLGIAILLFPTGGMESPFIWYALNPVLIGATFLNVYFCWLNLVFYFGSFILFAQNIKFSTIQSSLVGISEYSHIFLTFILATLIVQLFARLYGKLSKQTEKIMERRKDLEGANKALRESNQRVEESINEIMSLYQVVEAFSSQEDVGKLYEYFPRYASKLTKSPISFLKMKSEENPKEQVWTYKEVQKCHIEEHFIEDIESYWIDKNMPKECFEVDFENQKWVIQAIYSTREHYGFMGVKLGNEEESVLYNRHLNFLTELLGVILERYRLNKVAEHFMLVEEQNRIADEIHDNVSQKLFSITYGTHALISNLHGKLPSNTMDQLESIYEASKLAMKELRVTIYSLSSKKNGGEEFFTVVKKYLQQLAQLNSLKIDVEMKGEEDQISCNMRKGIYRLISEATGNAIKHSQCSTIEVKLSIHKSSILLIIKDDGIGINMESLNFKKGIGIQNMENIVQSFEGTFKIKSNEGVGTNIYIEMPVMQMNLVTQGGIA